MKRLAPLAWWVMAMLAACGQARADDSVTVHRLLLDVRSTHSDGAHAVDALVTMAKARGIDTLVITDHDRKGIRLGLAPMAGLIGWTIDRRSLYTTGLAPFFADLARARTRFPQTTLLAGTESVPGYTWSGVPFINLTLHDAERALITVGVARPAQIRALPSFTLRHVQGPVLFSILVWTALTAGLLWFLRRRHRRGLAWIVVLAAVVLALGWWLHTPADADARFIRVARGEGLFVIWAHPGTHSGVRPGPFGVRLDTPPYPKRVFRAPLADAFAAVYGDNDDLAVPGGAWDAELAAYLRGTQPRPVWAVSAGDFHAQGQANEALGNFPTDLWTADQTPAGVLTAMRRGHMVAWGLPRDRNLSFASLGCDLGGGHMLLPGGEARVGAHVAVVGMLAERPAAKPSARISWPVQLIVDGRVVATPTLILGQPFRWPLSLAPGAHAVRLRLWHGAVRMLSNPFLLRVSR